MLHDGLYEQVINKGLDAELANADKLSQTAPIDTAEASKVLAKYVAEVVERGLRRSSRCQHPRQLHHRLPPRRTFHTRNFYFR